MLFDLDYIFGSTALTIVFALLGLLVIILPPTIIAAILKAQRRSAEAARQTEMQRAYEEGQRAYEEGQRRARLQRAYEAGYHAQWQEPLPPASQNPADPAASADNRPL